MAVRDQDREALRARARELEAKQCGVGARIDDNRFGRCSLCADDVTVRPDRAELVTVHSRHGR
jgi:RNA polymerase-binding transcription factor DksA